MPFMENNELTNSESENNLIKTIEEKASEITGLSMEEIQAKAGDLIEKVKSGDLMEEGKSMLSNLMSGDANEKLGDLAKEAKSIWDRLTDSESQGNK
jgi:hypothetical protein